MDGAEASAPVLTQYLGLRFKVFDFQLQRFMGIADFVSRLKLQGLHILKYLGLSESTLAACNRKREAAGRRPDDGCVPFENPDLVEVSDESAKSRQELRNPSLGLACLVWTIPRHPPPSPPPLPPPPPPPSWPRHMLDSELSTGFMPGC